MNKKAEALGFGASHFVVGGSEEEKALANTQVGKGGQGLRAGAAAGGGGP